MEMHTVERLKAIADTGFKIVFIGNTPDRSASYADQLGGHSDADIRAAIVGLVRLSSVASVTDYASVPGALRRLGVHPDAEPSSPAEVLTQHRVDTNGDYYYFYNYNKVSNVDATWTRVPQHTTFPNIDKAANFIAKTVEYSLAGTGKPYQMDPSTGNIRAIPQFTASDGRIRVTVHLAGDEAILVALLSDQEAERNGVKPATTWATNFDAADGELTYATGGKLAIRAKSNANYTVRLNTGRSATASVSDLQPAQTIQDWSLTITSIEAPPNGSTLFQDSVWKDLGPFLLGTKLKPWNEIDPSLARVSGIGTYTGTFNLDRGWGEGGSAYLDLGDVAGAFSVTINGTMLPPQDPANTVVDLGPNAKKGVNTVAIRVATTLYNKVIQEGKPYGLLGTSGAINVSSYRLLFPNTLAQRVAAARASPDPNSGSW